MANVPGCRQVGPNEHITEQHDERAEEEERGRCIDSALNGEEQRCTGEDHPSSQRDHGESKGQQGKD